MEMKVCPYCKKLQPCEVKETGGLHYIWECSSGHQFERPTYIKIFSGSLLGIAIGALTGGLVGGDHVDGQADYADYHSGYHHDPMDG